MAKFDGTVNRGNTQELALYAEALAFEGKVIWQEMKTSPLLKAFIGKTIMTTELFDSASNPGKRSMMPVERQVRDYDVSLPETTWFFEWGDSTTATTLNSTSALAAAPVNQFDMVRQARFTNHMFTDRLSWPDYEKFFQNNRSADDTAKTDRIDLAMARMGRGFRNRINLQIMPLVNTGAVAAVNSANTIHPLEYCISDGLNQAARAAYYPTITGDNWAGSTSDHTNWATYGVNRAAAGNEPMRGIVRRVASVSAITDNYLIEAAGLLADRGAKRSAQVYWAGAAAYANLAAQPRSTQSVQITEEQQSIIKEFGIGTYFVIGGSGGILVARDPNIPVNTGYLLDMSTFAMGMKQMDREVGKNPNNLSETYLQVSMIAQLVCTNPGVNSPIYAF